jgi:hypothetical protein
MPSMATIASIPPPRSLRAEPPATVEVHVVGASLETVPNSWA